MSNKNVLAESGDDIDCWTRSESSVKKFHYICNGNTLFAVAKVWF